MVLRGSAVRDPWVKLLMLNFPSVTGCHCEFQLFTLLQNKQSDELHLSIWPCFNMKFSNNSYDGKL